MPGSIGSLPSSRHAHSTCYRLCYAFKQACTQHGVAWPTACAWPTARARHAHAMHVPHAMHAPHAMPHMPCHICHATYAIQARAHVLERFREDAHGNFYNPDELAAETEELFGKSFEQACCYTHPCSATPPCGDTHPPHATPVIMLHATPPHPLTPPCEQILQEEKLELGELGLTGSGPFSCGNPFSSFDEALRDAKAEEATARGSGATGSGGSAGGGGIGLRVGAQPEVAAPKSAGKPGSRGGSKGSRASKR